MSGDINPDLTSQQKERIVGFLGYGRLDAPIWFVGIEEGLGLENDEEAINNLRARAKFEPVMDLREAHEQLREDGRTIDIAHKKSFTAVWIWMAKIVLAHRGQIWDLESAKNYVRTKLGRRDGETFLTELSPIPSSRTSDKKWRNYFQQDGSIKSMLEDRRRKLITLLDENPPQLVICYGNSSVLKSKFTDLLHAKWEPVQTTPPISKSENSKYLLPPFFGNGRMSGSVIEALLRHQLIAF